MGIKCISAYIKPALMEIAVRWGIQSKRQQKELCMDGFWQPDFVTFYCCPALRKAQAVTS